jgi:hypothetical protein
MIEKNSSGTDLFSFGFLDLYQLATARFRHPEPPDDENDQSRAG